jgi:hypothetical protein
VDLIPVILSLLSLSSVFFFFLKKILGEFSQPREKKKQKEGAKGA